MIITITYGVVLISGNIIMYLSNTNYRSEATIIIKKKHN